jgi:Reverse transcriptase (RNA-dependent DNA polymerase)
LFDLKKKTDAKLITQFRPISFINYSFTIITKLLAIRLAPQMDNLISYTQTSYIKDKNIMNNVVVAQEILHQVRIRKTKDLLFKVDFKKALDTVN